MILIISPPANRFTLRRFGKINVLKKIKIKSKAKEMHGLILIKCNN